jgi:hypothetical protein
LARDGAAKHTVEAPVKANMVRQTKGEPAAYHHGVTVDDEPSVPLKSHEKPIGFHSAMIDRRIVGVANSPTSDQIIREAARFGRPPEKE